MDIKEELTLRLSVDSVSCCFSRAIVSAARFNCESFAFVAVYIEYKIDVIK